MLPSTTEKLLRSKIFLPEKNKCSGALSSAPEHWIVEKSITRQKKLLRSTTEKLLQSIYFFHFFLPEKNMLRSTI